MKTKNGQDKRETINARYDPEMDKYANVVLFPEKLARAKEKFRNVNSDEFIKKLEELEAKEKL